MNITQQDMEEIIAIQFGDGIYFAQAALDKVRELQDYTCLHPRATFKFMAEMDLSPKWEEYAGYPTIFDLKEYRKYCEEHP